MADKYPIKPVDEWNYMDGTYSTGDGKQWSVARLIKLAEDFPVYEVPVFTFPTYHWPWEDEQNLDTFISHVNRVQNSDLDVPLLISPSGGIIDGMHRLCKAVLEKKETIKVKYFKELPRPDCTYKD